MIDRLVLTLKHHSLIAPTVNVATSPIFDDAVRKAKDTVEGGKVPMYDEIVEVVVVRRARVHATVEEVEILDGDFVLRDGTPTGRYEGPAET